MWKCLADWASGAHTDQVRNTPNTDIRICNHFWVCTVRLHCDGCVGPSVADFMHHVNSMLCCHLKAEVPRDGGIRYKGKCQHPRAPGWRYSQHTARSWQGRRDRREDCTADHGQHHLHPGCSVCHQLVLDVAGQLSDHQGADARAGHWLPVCSGAYTACPCVHFPTKTLACVDCMAYWRRRQGSGHCRKAHGNQDMVEWIYRLQAVDRHIQRAAVGEIAAGSHLCSVWIRQLWQRGHAGRRAGHSGTVKDRRYLSFGHLSADLWLAEHLAVSLHRWHAYLTWLIGMK